jgi:hypothetical protein
VEQDRLIVFLTSRPVRSLSDSVPVPARVYMKRNGMLPRDIVILTLVAEEVPYITDERYTVANLGENVYGIQVRYGFMEDPDAPKLIRNLHRLGIVEEQVRSCAIKAGKEEFDIYPDATWWDRVRARLFNVLLRASTPAYAYFGCTASGFLRPLFPSRCGETAPRWSSPSSRWFGKTRNRRSIPTRGSRQKQSRYRSGEVSGASRSWPAGLPPLRFAFESGIPAGNGLTGGAESLRARHSLLRLGPHFRDRLRRHHYALDHGHSLREPAAACTEPFFTSRWAAGYPGRSVPIE